MTKKLTTKKLDKKLGDFGVFDLETFIFNGKHIPYCATYFDNKISFTYYLSKDENIPIEKRKDILLSQFFDKIIEVAVGKFVFAHNFSKFDGFYLVSYLMKKAHAKEIQTNDYNIMISPLGESKIYSIDYKIKRKSIKFRDWYLLADESLGNLAKLLNLNNQEFKKTIFPYKFLKEKPLNLFYKGEKPQLNEFFVEEEIIINNKIQKIPLESV